MKLFFIIWYVFQFCIAFYLCIPCILLLIYSVKRLAGKGFDIRKKKALTSRNFDFAAVITAHKDLSLVPALIDSLLKQEYSNYHIYVVADHCIDVSIDVSDSRVTVLQPPSFLDSKISSISFALDSFRREHDALVIFDSDNLVHPRFLFELNQYFQRGYRVVQSNLQPKNVDSIYARLDTIGNTFFNFTEREARMELGISSAIWGLGIAIDVKLYKNIIYRHHLGGFDKKVQASLIEKTEQIAFAREAIVYDEKVTSGEALETQRTRWINAYFRYFGLNLSVFKKGFNSRKPAMALFGLLNLRPPFFILIILVLISCAVNYFIHLHLFIAWLVILAIFGISFITIIARRSRDRRTVGSIIYLPLLISRQLFALAKMGRANKSFLKTEHTKLVYIEDLIGK